MTPSPEVTRQKREDKRRIAFNAVFWVILGGCITVGTVLLWMYWRLI